MSNGILILERKTKLIGGDSKVAGNYFSSGEIANLLNKSRLTINNWTKKGKFPNAAKVAQGDRQFYVIPRGDVEDFLQSEIDELKRESAKLQIVLDTLE